MIPLGHIILDIVLPRYCVLCHARGSDLCQPCLAKFERCRRELLHSFHAIFDYRDPRVRTAVHAMKYRNRFRITDSLGKVLFEEIVSLSGELLRRHREPICITGIPSHRKKTRVRGFNQSLLLVRAIARADKAHTFVYAPKALYKTRETTPQAKTKSRRERLSNLVDAFRVRVPLEVRGKIIIVVDDVITTGATFNEARRALKSAGAKNVIGVAIAH